MGILGPPKGGSGIIGPLPQRMREFDPQGPLNCENGLLGPPPSHLKVDQKGKGSPNLVLDQSVLDLNNNINAIVQNCNINFKEISDIIEGIKKREGSSPANEEGEGTIYKALNDIIDNCNINFKEMRDIMSTVNEKRKVMEDDDFVKPSGKAPRRAKSNYENLFENSKIDLQSDKSSIYPPCKVNPESEISPSKPYPYHLDSERASKAIHQALDESLYRMSFPLANKLGLTRKGPRHNVNPRDRFRLKRKREEEEAQDVAVRTDYRINDKEDKWHIEPTILAAYLKNALIIKRSKGPVIC